MKMQTTRRDFLRILSWAAASSMTAVALPVALQAAPSGMARQRQTAMPDQFEISAAELNQAVYVAIAAAVEDPQLDILAGVTYFMLQRHPNLLAGEIQAAIEELQGSIQASSPDREVDLSPDDTIYMSRVLTRLVPAVTNAHLQDGAEAYTRAFLNSFRRNVDPFRQVASIETQIDQFYEANRFRRDTWAKLYVFAAAHPEAATAINQSPIATVLGLQTTQDASALLAAVPIQPLSDFIAAHRQPNGALMAGLADIETVIEEVSASTLELSNEYTQILIDLNVVEQKTRDARLPWSSSIAGGAQVNTAQASGAQDDGDGNEKEKTELEKAIEEAEQRRKEWDSVLKDIRGGAKGTLDVFADLVGKHDADLAADIKKFSEVSLATLDLASKYSKTALTTAKALAGWLELGATGFAVLSGIGLGIGVIAIAIHIFGMFGKKDEPSIDQKILEGLQKLSEQISNQLGQLRQEMHLRFDRIEKQLNRMFVVLLEQFARIDWELGEIEGNVEEIQTSLYTLHSQLRRMHRDIYNFLEAEGRRDLTTAINGYLNYRERTGEELDFPTFTEAENTFFSWGKDHAADPLQAGPVERSFGDDDLLGELSTFPLATNINYLRRIPNQRFGLAELAPERLANPSDWTTAAEAYSQLNEEWPEHAARISPDRVEELMAVGERLGAALSNIGDMALMNALAAHYRAQFASLKTAVDAFETSFRNNPDYGLAGIDLWGGANQVPDSHFLDKPREFGRCDNQLFPSGAATLTADLSGFNLNSLAPFLVANNLDIGDLEGCITARWIQTDKVCTEIDPEPGGKPIPAYCGWKFRLNISIAFDYDGSSATALSVPNDGTLLRTLPGAVTSFDPNDPDDPNYSAADDPYKVVEAVWDQIEWNQPDLNVVAADHTPGHVRAETIDAVEAKLKELQRLFYAEVVERLGEADDPVQIAGDRLSGSKLLWQSFVALGLPLSVEANEFLRSLLFGSDAILAGRDAGEPDGLLDDIHNIYAFFAFREEDPPNYNIMKDIEQLVNDRVDSLLETLQVIIEGAAGARAGAVAADVLENMQSNGQPEASELFAPTLLRLSLVESLEPDTETGSSLFIPAVMNGS
jgi:hypothetical protein